MTSRIIKFATPTFGPTLAAQSMVYQSVASEILPFFAYAIYVTNPVVVDVVRIALLGDAVAMKLTLFWRGDLPDRSLQF